MAPAPSGPDLGQAEPSLAITSSLDLRRASLVRSISVMALQLRPTRWLSVTFREAVRQSVSRPGYCLQWFGAVQVRQARPYRLQVRRDALLDDGRPGHTPAV